MKKNKKVSKFLVGVMLCGALVIGITKVGFTPNRIDPPSGFITTITTVLK